MQKSVEDILSKVAERHGVHPDVVKKIWTNQWKYAAHRFRRGIRGDYYSFRFVYLPGLMRFYTAKRKVEKLQEIGEHMAKKRQEAIERSKNENKNISEES